MARSSCFRCQHELSNFVKPLLSSGDTETQIYSFIWQEETLLLIFISHMEYLPYWKWSKLAANRWLHFLTVFRKFAFLRTLGVPLFREPLLSDQKWYSDNDDRFCLLKNRSFIWHITHGCGPLYKKSTIHANLIPDDYTVRAGRPKFAVFYHIIVFFYNDKKPTVTQTLVKQSWFGPHR